MALHRRALGAGLLLALGARTAAAHHGWSWAEADQVEMTGTLKDIYVGPPHPRLQVEFPGQGLWTVELGNPSQTARAGFTETSAKVGDTVTALGNRSREAGERRLKAVRLTAGGRNYDFYPERIRG